MIDQIAMTFTYIHETQTLLNAATLEHASMDTFGTKSQTKKSNCTEYCIYFLEKIKNSELNCCELKKLAKKIKHFVARVVSW